MLMRRKWPEEIPEAVACLSRSFKPTCTCTQGLVCGCACGWLHVAEHGHFGVPCSSPAFLLQLQCLPNFGPRHCTWKLSICWTTSDIILLIRWNMLLVTVAYNLTASHGGHIIVKSSRRLTPIQNLKGSHTSCIVHSCLQHICKSLDLLQHSRNQRKKYDGSLQRSCASKHFKRGALT